MGNQRKISKAEYERLQEAHESATQAGAFDIEEPDTDGPTLASMGGGYRVGNVMLQQFTLETVALLSIVGVDMLELSNDDDSEQIRDIALALYIVANGAEACHMLMGVRQRVRALNKLEHLAKKSPEMFQRYIDKIDEIGGGAYAEIEARALEFMGQIEGATIDEIVDVIILMTEDFVSIMGLLPDNGDDGKKK
jgi:hypothetical protein